MRFFALKNRTEEDGKKYWRIEVQYDPPIGWKAHDYPLVPEASVIVGCNTGFIPFIVNFSNNF